MHVNTGLAAGLTPAEIAEVVVETSAFAGMPRSVTAATKLPGLFEKAGHQVPPLPAPREVLIEFLDGEPTVIGTGPDTAVAIYTEDGTPTKIVHARVVNGEVVSHTELTP